ncbi:MAG TPA: alpha/beta hydrolase [Gemmatimonadaceae bacterium]
MAFAALFFVTIIAPVVGAQPAKCVVLVHGAWVDGSGWKPVHDILAAEGYDVSIVQIPETSFQDDVTATKRVLDMQTGPCILVGHSYGGSVITEAGVHPRVVGLVYVAAAAPSVGHFEVEDEEKHPSVLAQTKGAVVVTRDGFTYVRPADFVALFAPDLPRDRAVFASRSQVMASAKNFRTPLTVAAWQSKPSWAIVAGDDKIINPEVEKMWYARAKSHVTTLAGVGHDVYEARPKEVAAVIKEAAQRAKP